MTTTTTTPPISESVPPISIIGAGHAGLLLARYLQLHGLPCTIYEREASLSSTTRLQPTFSLNSIKGVDALVQAEVFDEVRAAAKSLNETMRFSDKKGELLVGRAGDDDDEEKSKPKETCREELVVDCNVMRQILVSKLDPDTINWCHTVTSCQPLSSSLYQVNFQDQPPITTSILIGADGASSTVRGLLHGPEPVTTGWTYWSLVVPLTNQTPELKEYVGPGKHWVFGSDKSGMIAFMTSTCLDGRWVINVGRRVSPEWLAENPMPEEGKREWVKGMFDDEWDVKTGELIMAGEEESVEQKEHLVTPPFRRWSTDLTGVAILGEAAHTCPESAAHAYIDAADLGHTLVQAYTTPPHPASRPPFPLSFLPISAPPPTHPQFTTPSPAKLQAALRAFEERMMGRLDYELHMVDTWAGIDVDHLTSVGVIWRVVSKRLYAMVIGMPMKWWRVRVGEAFGVYE
ncbi:hypothetical protein IAT38_004805 [Cryptococcus sp. DSM 104549]